MTDTRELLFSEATKLKRARPWGWVLALNREGKTEERDSWHPQGAPFPALQSHRALVDSLTESPIHQNQGGNPQGTGRLFHADARACVRHRSPAASTPGDAQGTEGWQQEIFRADNRKTPARREVGDAC